MTTTTATNLTVGTWAIEPAHSEVGFTVRHLGLSKVRGRFNSFTGSADVADQLDHSTIEAVIVLSSVDTNNDQRDGHLRSTDFFDVETQPRMTFTSTNIDATGSRGTINGDLTINGVSRNVTLDAEFHGVAVDAYGTTRAGFSAAATISRKDFAVDFNVPLDAGGVLIGDKIAIELEIQLVPTN
ncbi:MAG: YceI family protein [Actinomycetota bacterium]|jgi:polyisoprenoid-binding protein YceI|nr:YceI family protein [Actinomycetota bacterium]